MSTCTYVEEKYNWLQHQLGVIVVFVSRECQAARHVSRRFDEGIAPTSTYADARSASTPSTVCDLRLTFLFPVAAFINIVSEKVNVNVEIH